MCAIWPTSLKRYSGRERRSADRHLLIVGIFCAILLSDRIGRIHFGFVGCAAGLLLASLSAFCTGSAHILLIFLGLRFRELPESGRAIGVDFQKKSYALLCSAVARDKSTKPIRSSQDRIP
jgi:hypothetical protein